MKHVRGTRLVGAAITVIALVGLSAGCGQPAGALPAPAPATVTVTATVSATATPTGTAATAAASPTPRPTPDETSTITGSDGVIVCFDRGYNEHDFDVPQDAWPRHYDDCDSPGRSGTPDARELKALDVAYGKTSLSSLAVLYDMCATTAPKTYDYLRTAGTPPQLREVRGMLVLCPNHPLRHKIESYLGGARERNRLEASGRIFYAGTYRIGKQIQPGTYFAQPAGDSCYWERDDAGGGIRDNNFSSGLRVQVTIEASDFSFTSEGCGKWQPVR